MNRRLRALGLALTMATLLPTLGAAAEVSLKQRWAALFEPAAKASCAATILVSSARAGVASPAFMTMSKAAGEEIESCWCCAKIGDPACCKACFGEESLSE